MFLAISGKNFIGILPGKLSFAIPGFYGPIPTPLQYNLTSETLRNSYKSYMANATTQ